MKEDILKTIESVIEKGEMPSFFELTVMLDQVAIEIRDLRRRVANVGDARVRPL